MNYTKVQIVNVLGGEPETRTLKPVMAACFQDRVLIQPDTLLVGGVRIELHLNLAYEASQFTRTVPSIIFLFYHKKSFLLNAQDFRSPRTQS